MAEIILKPHEVQKLKFHTKAGEELQAIQQKHHDKLLLLIEQILEENAVDKTLASTVEITEDFNKIIVPD